jgi:hypothetical protein
MAIALGLVDVGLAQRRYSIFQHAAAVGEEYADRQAALVILRRSNFVNAGIGEKPPATPRVGRRRYNERNR